VQKRRSNVLGCGYRQLPCQMIRTARGFRGGQPHSARTAGHGRGPRRYVTAGYLDVVRDMAGGKGFLDDRGLGDDRHIDKEKASKEKRKKSINGARCLSLEWVLEPL